MKCQKCGNEQIDTVQCESCGIYFAKYEQAQMRRAQSRTKVKKNGGSGVLMVGLFAVVCVSVVGYMVLAGDGKNGGTDIGTETGTDGQEMSTVLPEGTSSVNQLLAEKFKPKNAVEKARNATVFIETDWGSIGSGVIVTPDCWVVTNSHVMKFNANDAKESAYQDQEVNDRLRREMLVRNRQMAELLNRRTVLISSGGSVESIKQLNREIERLRTEINSLPQAYKEAIDEKIDEYKEGTENTSYTVSVVDGTEFVIGEVYLSRAYDLAVFQLPAGDCPYVKLSANNDIAQGTRLYTIGNPSGLGYTVTSGVFSGYRQSDEGEYIQTDAPINPGNSGGPLVTPLGLLVGINTMILTGTEGIGFAIPVGTVEADFGDIIDFEKADIEESAVSGL